MSRRRGLTIAIVCTFSSLAVADEPVRHVVKANETCAAIAERYYGDSRLVDILHNANPELASKPPPHNLREGMILLIPPRKNAAGGSAPDAQLTTVRNRVDVLTPETKQGKPNDPLFRGNRVSTQEASAADVTFRDETQVKLGERTLVIILGDAKSAAAKTDASGNVNPNAGGIASSNETTLVTGNLRAFMAGRKDSSVAVGSEAAKVRVFRGEAQVSADAVKTTRLAVYNGSSTIDARGTLREVTPGFGSKAVLGREPTVPRPLPIAPIWSSPPASVILDTGSPVIAGEYDIHPANVHVSEWHVQIARDEGFREVAVDTKAPALTHRLEIQPPKPGHYFVRVSAIDDDHFEGPYSRIARVLVIKASTTYIGLRRRIDLDPPDAACMRVGNANLSWVKGSLDVGKLEPVRLRCAPTASESDPTTLLVLDGDAPISPSMTRESGKER